jgi:secreted trypsin-like serine protease
MPRLSVSRHEELVREAIGHAKTAGRDDRAFLDALRGRYFAMKREETLDLPAMRSLRTGVSAPEGAAPFPGVQSFHIYEDPRFLANARKLALRTEGGMRIIGGQPVPTDGFLDCVAVGSDNQWGCTGTLIAPNVVITAGHCADFATRIFIGNDVTKPGTVVRVASRHRHPKYHQGRHNDLLVLLLEQSVNVKPRRMVTDPAVVDAASDGRVVGFGATEASGIFGYGVKRQTDVPIASPSCSGKTNGGDDAQAYGCDRGVEIVAGKPLLNEDTCNGDSGGPFYLASGKDWLLAGATSRATDSAVHNCGDGGIYVRVDRYQDWIASVTAPPKPAGKPKPKKTTTKKAAKGGKS